MTASPTFLHPHFPGKGTWVHPRQKLQCGATVPAIPVALISRCLDATQVVLVWYFQICMPGAGKPIPEGSSCWQMTMQDMDKGHSNIQLEMMQLHFYVPVFRGNV